MEGRSDELSAGDQPDILSFLSEHFIHCLFLASVQLLISLLSQAYLTDFAGLAPATAHVASSEFCCDAFGTAC